MTSYSFHNNSEVDDELKHDNCFVTDVRIIYVRPACKINASKVLERLIAEAVFIESIDGLRNHLV